MQTKKVNTIQRLDVRGTAEVLYLDDIGSVQAIDAVHPEDTLLFGHYRLF